MAGEHILIVEDEREVARGFEYGLTGEGVMVLVAATGEQAMRQLTSNSEALARQAVLQMVPEVRQVALRELARASSFTGGARARVLDEQRRVLADSDGDDLQFILTSVDLLQQVEERGEPFIVAIRQGEPLSSGVEVEWERLSDRGREVFVRWDARKWWLAEYTAWLERSWQVQPDG